MEENPSKLNLKSTISNNYKTNDVFENKTDSSNDAEFTFEETKITCLDDDCLDVIFQHLDLDDLVNVADSSKHFQNATCRVYKSKYRNMRPIFDSIQR